MVRQHPNLFPIMAITTSYHAEVTFTWCVKCKILSSFEVFGVCLFPRKNFWPASGLLKVDASYFNFKRRLDNGY